MSAPLWTACEAVTATKGRNMGQDWAASGVSIDSRTVLPGDLFVAITGPNNDGHDYVKAALAAGACAALVHKIPDGMGGDAPLLHVEDSMAGLEALARAARARSPARICAVTGSVGKTGTKEMLALALGRQGFTHCSAGNLNNHWGVPLSLARLPASAAFAVFELGMNHPGEIAPLTRLVRPHVAIITTIEAVHAAHFSGTEQIADAKAEIFEGIEPGGVAVLNRDNRHFARLADAARARGAAILSFGNHIDADARLLDCGIDPARTAIFALIGDHPIAYSLGVAGQHWALNSLAVLLASRSMGAAVDQAAAALTAMTPPKGRGLRQRAAIKGGSIEVIDESYNASPVSMKAAIATLAAQRPAKGARRIAVLGDMLELGEASAEQHAGLATALSGWGIDCVFTAGPLMAHLHEALPPERRGRHFKDADEAATALGNEIHAGDVVMVKGSAGSRMGRVVKALCEGR